ncbi:hypothetical protein ACFVFS_05505 [Kitasatospora sp. NPDC057692]
MTCHCGGAMYINGRFWQCPKCGHLIPLNGYAPAHQHGGRRRQGALRC